MWHPSVVLKHFCTTIVVHKGVSNNSVNQNSMVHKSVVHNSVNQNSVIYKGVVHKSVVHNSVNQNSVVYKGVVHNSVNQNSVVYKGVVHKSVVHKSVGHKCSSQSVPQNVAHQAFSPSSTQRLLERPTITLCRAFPLLHVIFSSHF